MGQWVQNTSNFTKPYMQYLGGKYLKGREYLHDRAREKDGNCDDKSAGLILNPV